MCFYYRALQIASIVNSIYFEKIVSSFVSTYAGYSAARHCSRQHGYSPGLEPPFALRIFLSFWHVQKAHSFLGPKGDQCERTLLVGWPTLVGASHPLAPLGLQANFGPCRYRPRLSLCVWVLFLGGALWQGSKVLLQGPACCETTARQNTRGELWRQLLT